MRPKVTAVVVARDAAAPLERTIAALGAQTVRPHTRIFVHLESRDDTLQVMREGTPDLLLTIDSDASFGRAVATAVSELDATSPIRDTDEGDLHPNEWLWLLSSDSAPEPGALEALLDTAERNPSLEVTGPKLVDVDDPSRVYEFGRSLAPNGEAVKLHADALDQGQFETLSDVLGVAPEGMLVRRDTWNRLRGFDPGLDAVDYSLDFSVRTWLSGGRVLASPDARVETLGNQAPGTARFGRRTRHLARYRLRRTALLHRRLAWSSALTYWLNWLLLLPEVVVRAVMHLLRKQPGRILPDLRAALTVFLGFTGAIVSRGRFAATKQQPLGTLDRLMISGTNWRKMRAHKRDEQRASAQLGRDRYNFITGGGGWVLLITALASAIMLFPAGATGTLSGGGLLPLSPTLGELWANTGYGPRNAGGGIGVADPFQYLLAVLGTLTFWQPSLVIVIVWFLAMPLSAMGAWYLAARFTRRGWLRAFFALAWAFAPMQLAALADGSLPGVLVHLTIPWFAFATFAASRSWASSATASLLALIIVASAPSLIPGMIVLWLIVLVRAGRGWVRQVFLPIPAAAMFLPLAVAQFNRGRPLAVFADPGLPVPHEPLHGWMTVFGFPNTGLGGWPQFLAQLGWDEIDPALLFICLLAPLGILAIIGVVGAGWRLALAGLIVAGLAAVTAGIAGGVLLTAWGNLTVPLLIGPAQSAAFFGVLVAALAGAAVVGPVRVPVTLIALVGIVLLIVPIAPAHYTGDAAAKASDGRTLPAIVDAQGRAATQLGTLVITPFDRQQMHVHLERGSGMKLDGFSTLSTSDPILYDDDRALAEIAVDFLGEGKTNPTSRLHQFGIGFVLVEDGTGNGQSLAQRLVTGLSTNEAVVTVGPVDGYGMLFQVVNAAEQPTNPELARQLEATNWQNLLGRTMLIVQSAILVFVVLLALPTGGLATRVRASRDADRQWADLDRGRPMDVRRRYQLNQEKVEVYDDAASGERTEQPEEVNR